VTVRIRTLLAVTAVLAVVIGIGVYAISQVFPGKLPHLGPSCTVKADGQVTLDPTQMANAATIAAVGIRRNLPERAVVVALATALQESKLENLTGGDRDSVGLFQQRPSQGWGTEAQIRDPRYAAGKFYDALRKVSGWEAMKVTDAAQSVQRSAHPTAYERWADESTVLTTALSGQATGAVACTVTGNPAVRGSAATTALTKGLRLDWGDLRPASSANLLGLTLSVGDDQVGWQYAHWLVSHARDSGLKRVSFGDLAWTAKDGSWSKVGQTEAVAARRVFAEVFSDK
jgi:hypothetical protein